MPILLRSLMRALVGAAALLLLAGCDAKESDFFTFVSDSEDDASIDIVVDGTPAGATVRVTGIDVDVSATVDEIPRIFAGLDFGDYLVEITPPSGYTCDRTAIFVTLDEEEPDAELTVECSPLPGIFLLNLAGITGGLSVPVEITGPSNLSGEVGIDGLQFTGLALGNYAWLLTQLAGWQCLPLSGEFTILAGSTITQSVTCTATEGSLSVTVIGATAPVQYSGPESGGASVGSTPVVFDNLLPGVYTVGINPPLGVDCQPLATDVTVTAGATASVQFTCTGPTLTELSVDLANFQAGPGVVASGTYPVTVRDVLLVAVASMAIQTIGLQTFFGITPDRLGFDGSSGYRLDTFFQVGTLFFTVRALQVCAINAALSGSNFLALTYYNASLVLLASAAITSLGCFWMDVPVGTRFIQLLGPAAGFVDIQNIRLRGILST